MLYPHQTLLKRKKRRVVDVTHHTTLRLISFDGALGVDVEFDGVAVAAVGLGFSNPWRSETLGVE